MKVIAFVGPSGTGKSHRAFKVANDLNIDVLIDDGLLIKEGKIIAGISAKQQPTRIGAIKTALFSDEKHCAEVKLALKKFAPQKVLLLATSEEMAQKIARRLDLPQPEKYIRIEEIADRKEIKKALRMRKIEGMHVIPAPTLEVQSRFLGALIEPLQIILPRHKETASPQLWTEQSMVRPTFTTLGKFYITETALKQIITYVINRSHLFGPIHNIAILNISKQKGNVVFKIELSGIYGTPLHLRTKILQKLIKKEVEYATDLNVQAVNIKIKNLVFKTK